MKRFLIDRNELPYDAMVPDERLLIPIFEEGGDADGTERKEAHAHGDQGAGGQSGQTETE